MRRLFWTVPLLASAASACPMCFGAQGQDVTRGYFWGTMVLIVAALGSVGGLALMIMKAARAADAPPAPPRSAPLPR